MTKLILGDNPFFGVNHSKAAAKLGSEDKRFEEAASIIDCAITNGHNVFMMSNHPTCTNLLSKVSNATLTELELAFVLPYPHTYNNLIAEGGYFAAIKYFLRGNVFKLINILFSLLRFKFPKKILTDMVVESELNSLHSFRHNVKYLCLHNIFVDMALASNNVEYLTSFIDVARGKGLKPVLITQNLKALVSMVGSSGYTACFSMNKSGYMVNPELDGVISFINNNDCPDLWAMQVLASGSVPVDDAFDFIKVNDKVSGILYATTQKQRFLDFSSTFKEFYSKP